MNLVPGPRQVLREAAMLTALPRGLAGLAWECVAAPVRHVEETGDDDGSGRPALPPLPEPSGDDQPAEAGHGPVLHRRFAVHVERPRLGPVRLVALLAQDMNRVMLPGVARFDRRPGASGAMQEGDELVVRMPGPWDGPVRVVDRTPCSFRLATLAGHLEAGQIEFAATPAGGGDLEFTITTWARAGDRLADLLYNRLGLAKEIQFRLWAHACTRAAALAGGHLRGGVEARTRVLPWRAESVRDSV